MSFILNPNEEGGLWIINNHLTVLKNLCNQKKFQNRLSIIREKYFIKEDTFSFLSYGGQGVVFKGYSELYNTDISVKIPFYNPYELDLSKEQAILREAKIIELFKNVTTPYVPKMYDYDFAGKYIIKKYYDIPNLGESLKDKKWDRNRLCLSLIRQFIWIVSFLEEIDEHMILTDWKATNILCDNISYQPLLIDFGNTKKTEQIMPNHVLSISKIGSGHFLHWPPELLVGDRSKCGLWCNAFILGVQLFYILCGKYPYSNDEPYRSWEELMTTYKMKFYNVENEMSALIILKQVDKSLGEFIISLINPDYRQRGDFYDFTNFV